MSHITTHVLDTSIGKPAKGIEIKLHRNENSGWHEIAKGVSDIDGRISDLIEIGKTLDKGIYKMEFRVDNYFRQKKIKSLYPYIEIIFMIEDEEHYHIPLLLSPFGYSTYRGS